MTIQIIKRIRNASLVKWVLLFYLFTFLPLNAQIGTWRAFMSYYEPQQIVKAGSNTLFVRASNSLYSYNINDHSITTYDKVNALSDTYISLIAWNQQAKRLIIVYQNGNIDLMDLQENVTNISSLYTKTLTESKTVNNIYIYQQYAYLCMPFGVIKVNMERAEISETYQLNKNINAIGINGDNLYIRSSDNIVLVGNNTKNLIDPNNWSISTTYPTDIFNINNSDWDNYQELVATLKPEGPKYNYFGFLKYKNNRLYTCGGGYTPDLELTRPGTIQIYKDEEWTILQDNIADITGWIYIDVDAMDADPNDPNHIFAGGRTGLYEFQDGQFLKAYNIDNSPLQSAVNPDNQSYVIIEGLCFDNTGSLFVLNSSTLGLENILEYTKNNQWVSHKQDKLTFTDSRNRQKSVKGMQSAFIDSRGYLWFVSYNWELPAFYCYNPEKKLLVHDFTSFTNQDGVLYSSTQPVAITEDLNGNIWIGTTEGPFLLEADRVNSSDNYLTQVKVPRNDGSNYADYLMAETSISCIVIDGGNRKWFGTRNNGIYLISADNMVQLAHYTSENSPLLSNNIESLTINNQTGELFIGTDMGLCSFMTDATVASEKMEKDNVYAYPNPVESGYTGLITVVGLSFDADVKILTSNGKLVAQGRSNGGTFTWNGCDRSGRRVSSGIYLVATANNDGNEGIVCKIAIIK